MAAIAPHQTIRRNASNTLQPQHLHPAAQRIEEASRPVLGKEKHSTTSILTPVKLNKCRNPLISSSNSLYNFRDFLKEKMGTKSFNTCYGNLEPSESFSYNDADEINLCVAIARWGIDNTSDLIDSTPFSTDVTVMRLMRIVSHALNLSGMIFYFSRINFYPTNHAKHHSYTQLEKNDHVTIIGLSRALIKKGALHTVLPLVASFQHPHQRETLLTCFSWWLTKEHSPEALVAWLDLTQPSIRKELLVWCFFARYLDSDRTHNLIALLKRPDKPPALDVEDILVDTVNLIIAHNQVVPAYTFARQVLSPQTLESVFSISKT